MMTVKNTDSVNVDRFFYSPNNQKQTAISVQYVFPIGTMNSNQLLTEMWLKQYEPSPSDHHVYTFYKNHRWFFGIVLTTSCISAD